MCIIIHLSIFCFSFDDYDRDRGCSEEHRLRGLRSGKSVFLTFLETIICQQKIKQIKTLKIDLHLILYFHITNLIAKQKKVQEDKTL